MRQFPCFERSSGSIRFEMVTGGASFVRTEIEKRKVPAVIPARTASIGARTTSAYNRELTSFPFDAPSAGGHSRTQRLHLDVVGTPIARAAELVREHEAVGELIDVCRQFASVGLNAATGLLGEPAQGVERMDVEAGRRGDRAGRIVQEISHAVSPGVRRIEDWRGNVLHPGRGKADDRPAFGSHRLSDLGLKG